MDIGYNTDGTAMDKVEVDCPYCGSTNTELFSLFGQQLLTVQFYCNACHTPFERIKDDTLVQDYVARKENNRDNDDGTHTY